MVACVWELTKEIIDLPLGCLQGGSAHIINVGCRGHVHVCVGVGHVPYELHLLLLYSRHRSWKVLEPKAE